MKSLSVLTLALLLAGCASPTQPPGPAAFVPSRAEFEGLFPQRLDFYSYEGFVAAVQQTPGFADRGSAEQRRQEMAAFLGQIAHESDQLRAQREYRRENWDKYCRPGGAPGCAAGQQYYGRGPIQLSWNYQYKRAGDFLGIDLWSDPDRVARDSTVAWRTALWYWMTQPGESSRSPHEALQAQAGFGATTRAINGPLECDKPGDPDARRKNQRRIDFYKHASELFGVPLLHPLGC